MSAIPLRPCPSHQLSRAVASDSLIVGITASGKLQLWAVSAPTITNVLEKPAIVELQPPACVTGRSVSVVSTLSQTLLTCSDHRLATLAVGYQDGTVDMMTLQPAPETVRSDFEPLHLWSTFTACPDGSAVTHLALASSMRLATVTQASADVVQIFEAESTLSRCATSVEGQ